MTEVGKGAYGTVKIVDGCAVKEFRKYSHLVQESIAGVFLKGQEHVVEFIGADFKNITLSMKAYPITLRKWLNETDSQPRHLKDEMARQLLKGLTEIHSLHLVHGDIKPGNILIQRDPLKLVIADLGFISLRPYSKCERTAAVYRDTNVKSCFGHDIYSTGIIFLEMYGDLKVRQQGNYDELKGAIRDEISDQNLRKILNAMIHKNHDKRPSAGDVYYKMFGEMIVYPSINSHFEVDSEYPKIRRVMRRLSEKYDIMRPNRGYKALVNYIGRNYNSYRKYGYEIYATSMIFILSSVFGRYTTFDQKNAAEYSNCKESVIVKITSRLCLDGEVVQYLMTP